ncbi:hypothetical protein RYX36_011588 [Vicia faba]
MLVLGVLICVFSPSLLLSPVVNIMHGETACICKFIIRFRRAWFVSHSFCSFLWLIEGAKPHQKNNYTCWAKESASPFDNNNARNQVRAKRSQKSLRPCLVYYLTLQI